jgi:hypothetical protein
VRRIRQTQIETVLADAGVTTRTLVVDPHRRVRDLTDRQRDKLAELLVGVAARFAAAQVARERRNGGTS